MMSNHTQDGEFCNTCLGLTPCSQAVSISPRPLGYQICCFYTQIIGHLDQNTKFNHPQNKKDETGVGLL
jgi:hypothetical protein